MSDIEKEEGHVSRILELTDMDSSRPEIAADIGMSEGTVYYHQRKHNKI